MNCGVYGNRFYYQFFFSFGYYYLKDIFFNYLEQQTKDSFILRKTTSTDKEVELIKLETKKEKELVKLSEIRARNKEIDDLKTDNNILSEKIETLNVSIQNLNKETVDLNGRINYLISEREKFVSSFHYFLSKLFYDSSIQDKIKLLSESEFKELKNDLYIVLNQYKRKIDPIRDSERISYLEEMNVGFFKLNNGILIDVEFTSFGAYILLVEIFSSESISKLDLKFTPNSIFKLYPNF